MTMKLRVLYFAAVRDLVGAGEEEVVVPDGLDVAAFRHWLERERAALAGRLAPVRFARNEAFADDRERLADGDTIALIPPVAGG